MKELRDIVASLERQSNTNQDQLALSVSDLIDLGENSVTAQHDIEPVSLSFGSNQSSRLIDVGMVHKISKSDADFLQKIENSLDAEDGITIDLNNHGQFFSQPTQSMPDLINFDESVATQRDVNKSVSLPSLPWLNDEMIHSVNIDDLVAYFQNLNTTEVFKILNDFGINGLDNSNNNLGIELPASVNTGNQANQTHRLSKEHLDKVRRQLSF